MATGARFDARSRRTRRAPQRTGDGAPPELDLLVDFAGAEARLRAHLPSVRTTDDVFDAFLLAGALDQILADHLHRDVRSLGRVARHLPAVAGRRVGTPAAAAARAGRAAGLAARALRPSERALVRRHGEVTALVRELASHVAAATVPDALAAPRDGAPPALCRTVARLPHCFRSFDQRPDDVERLVASFAARRPARARRLLVIGLRTAGTYLAPLAAAFLEREGYERVDVLTMRPEQDWLAHERRALGRAVAGGAQVLVVDEPPRAGAQLVLAATQLERSGVPRAAIVLLVPLFASAVPPALEQYETVALPWEEWAVHERLTSDAAKRDLAALLPGVAQIERVRPETLPPAPRRGHVAAVFRVELDDGEVREICVEGAGLGYLGRHAVAVAEALPEFFPAVHGLRDGLLYREWLPDDARLAPGDASAARIAAYVAARNRALAVPEDTSRRLAGRSPAWEIAANMLGSAFGRARVVVRPLTHRVARRLLRTTRPSVTDGSMSLAHWFAPDGVAAARKVGFHQRSFSNQDRACYDPVYDLAGAASEQLDESLRRAYEELTGAPVAPERWLLYRLVHHADELRAAADARDGERLLAAEHALAGAQRSYVAGAILADVAPPATGALCALDVDWVLEVRWLGAPMISPAAARTLRALVRHGYRPVVATGRSLGAVRDRCRAFGLAGGVGEYGAVVYDHGRETVRSLLSEDGAAALAELRELLLATPGVHLDPAHEHSVRAFRVVEAGRSGLSPEAIEDALARVGRDRFRAVTARSQTDFVAAGIDKGRGVRALAEALGEERVALAVGDASEDLPMLAQAERAVAPANADATVRGAGIRVTRRTYAAGLAEAVAGLLGHAPGGCAVCAPPPARSDDAALLLCALGALDGAAKEKARQAVRLATRLAVR